MKVVVDTSVWSQALRRRVLIPSAHALLLTRLIQEESPLFLLGIILQELLSGLRSDSDFDKVLNALSPFPLIDPARTDYMEAAKIRNRCAGKGVSAGTIDCLIAVICIQYDCLLLTADTDFDAIAKHSALKLLHPPRSRRSDRSSPSSPLT